MAYITKQRVLWSLNPITYLVVNNKTLFQTSNTCHEKNLQTEFRGQQEETNFLRALKLNIGFPSQNDIRIH